MPSIPAPPASPATIVALAAADRADWAPLWRAYLEFCGAELDATTIETTFVRLTGGDEPMGGFLARARRRRGNRSRHWIVHRSCWTVGDYCYLQDLFVAPGRRGGGVGRRLIEAVAAAARARGCLRLHWLTHEANRAAMRLYDQVAERPGFVQYRVLLG